MPLLVGGAILGGSLLSGYFGNKAAGKQADVSSAASQAAIEEQRRQFDIAQANAAPFQLAGNVALNQLMANLGLPSGAIQNYYGQQMGGGMGPQMGQFQRPMAGSIPGIGMGLAQNMLARGANQGMQIMPGRGMLSRGIGNFINAQNPQMQSGQAMPISNDMLRRIYGARFMFK